MSTNAATWFYSEPEHNNFLVAERLNATFWQARIVGIYWRGVEAENGHFRALGYGANTVVEMEWVPGQWLALKVPDSAVRDGINTIKVDDLVESIGRRVLAMPAALSYGDAEGRRVYEWHTDQGAHRWSQIQGQPGFYQPKRLKK